MDQLEKPFVLMLVSAKGKIWMNFLKNKNEILTYYFQFMNRRVKYTICTYILKDKSRWRI